MISTPKVWPITSKGHSAKFYASESPINRRHFKKQARRAQRRASHKEVEEQWLADWPNSLFFVGQRWQKYVALLQCIEPPMNMFSPVPPFMMSEWEKAGIEWYRERPNMGKGVRHWKKYQRNITTDETLLEDLERSLKR